MGSYETGWFVLETINYFKSVYTTSSGLNLMSETQHLPKSIQSASYQWTLTFQLNCGILLGVNLDIQTVLLNF